MTFPYSKYDIRNKLLRAETSTLRHKNALHTEGDRYVIVLYNKNLNYAGTQTCTRSCAIKAQSPVQTSYLLSKDSLLVDQYRKELLSLLSETKFPKERSSAMSNTISHSKYGSNEAHVISFGISASRKSRQVRAEAGITTRKAVNTNNTKYLRLYQTLYAYLEELHPTLFGFRADHKYHACIVAKNSQCEWHTDKHNIGHACFTALGDYKGGEVMIEDAIPVTPDYIICIPTYKRVDTFRKKTYAKVIERYALHSKVILLLQNDEDEEAYTKAFPELDFLRTPAGLLQTVNFAAQYFPKQQRMIMMHDDITRVLKLDANMKRQTVLPEAGDTFFANIFDKMDENGCHLGGLYPCDYLSTMRTLPECTTDLRFIHDPLTFMINLQIPLKLEYKTDFERTVLYYKHDGKVLRMNHCTINTAYNPKDKGGIGHRDMKAEKEACETFVEEYGEYVKQIKTHKNGSTSMILKRNVSASAHPLYKQVVITQWGYKSVPKIVDSLTLTVREGTTDETVIKEVLTTTGTYQNRRVPLLIESTDTWLDLGANIGTFSLHVLSKGGRVIAVEPEKENIRLLKKNLALNFDGGYTVVPKAVSTESGTYSFFLCNTAYNKYRHSMHISNNRQKVQVEGIGLSDLLKQFPSVNAIKIDIEGEEIPLLESLSAEHVQNVNKLTFEYSFDVDTSIRRFTDIIAHLKTMFHTIKYKKLPDVETWDVKTMFPHCRQVWCIK